MFDKRKQYDPTIYEIPTSEEIVDTIKAFQEYFRVLNSILNLAYLQKFGC